MNNNFDELIAQLYELTYINKDKQPQIVDNNSAIKAWFIASNIKLKKEGDLLLLLTTMCLLNTYVKQKQDDLIHFYSRDYFFKDCGVLKIIDSMKKNFYPHLKMFYMDKEKFDMNVIFFNFDKLQYSFHGFQKGINFLLPQQYLFTTKFNDIQNKNCIVTMFELLLTSNIEFSNETLDGKNLLDEMNVNATNYLNKKMSNTEAKKVFTRPLLKYLDKYANRLKELKIRIRQDENRMMLKNPDEHGVFAIAYEKLFGKKDK